MNTYPKTMSDDVAIMMQHGRLTRFFLALLVLLMTAATARAGISSNIDVCKGGLGEVCIGGWVYDTERKSLETAEYDGIAVRAVVSTKPNKDDDDYDENESYEVKYVERPDVNSAFGLTGIHGFRTKVSVFPPWFGVNNEMTVYVKIYATIGKHTANPQEILLKSTSTTVRTNYGYGTEDIPYVISNAAEWDTMADLSPFYADSYIRLANMADDYYDYDNSTAITKAFGLSACPFAGHFDGRGQTLNVNISSTEQYTAPFAYVNGASIHDLTVSGTVNGSQYAGGIVGHATGTLSMECCICDASIINFTQYAGGLVGFCEDMTLNLQNCLFKGSFSVATGSTGMSQPIAVKNIDKPFTRNVHDVYYVNTETMDDIRGVLGIPVSRYFVTDEWHIEMRLIDGLTYYGNNLPDEWNAATGTLYVNSNPGEKYFEDRSIIHLIIGRGVTNIEKRAFCGCINIKTVTFEQGSQLECIGDDAFTSCKALTEITIPASVRTIGELAFNECHVLRSFTAAEGSQLETIGFFIFNECLDLTSIALLGVMPPTAPKDWGTLEVDKLKFYVRSAEYKNGEFWETLYNSGKWLTFVYKFTAETGVSAITAPTFTSEGNIYYGEGTTVILAPGNYTVTDADGNDITATVLNGSTLTMPSCDVTVTGQSEVEEDLTISTEEEWNTFASKVNSGASYITSTVTLAADISVSTMVGTAEHPFGGTFDGAGHTLDVAISSTEQYAAPFSHIELATIKNLTVTGSVSSSGNYAAGLVGGCALTNTISDCTVRTSVSGASYAGGIVGHGGSDKLTLEGCVFGGTVSGFTNYAGGLMGWCDELTLTIDDCLMTGTLTPGSLGQYHPIACKNNAISVSASLSYTYYLHPAAPTATGDFIIDGVEGKPVSATLNDGVWDEPIIGADGNTYYASHIVGKNLPYTYGFENNDLALEGWTQVNGGSYIDTSWSVWPAYEGNHFFFFYPKDSGYKYLISPKIDGETDIEVSFYFGNTTRVSRIEVGYSTTNSELRSFTWDEKLDKTFNWRHFSKIFPVGTKYVAFRIAEYYGSLALDNFLFRSYYGSAPANLATSNLTKTECTLTWTYPDATAMGFAYQYKKSADDVWSERVATTDMSATLSGLTQNTEYDFRVKTLFVNGTSSDFSTFRFITEGGLVTLPYYEGFEDGLDGWCIANGASNTGIVSPASDYLFEGTHGFLFSSSSQTQYLISPQLDINPSLDWYLSFSFRNYDPEATGDNTNNAVFQFGYAMTNNIDDFTWTSNMECSNSWTTMTLNLPLQAKYFAIKWAGGNNMLLDDVILKELNKVPTQIAATDITSTSADISWAGSAGQFGLRYREQAWFQQDFESCNGGFGNSQQGWRGRDEKDNFIRTGLTSWQTFRSNGNNTAVSTNERTVINDNDNSSYTEILDLDDWLYTPIMPLSGTVVFHARFKPLGNIFNSDYDKEYDKAEVLVCSGYTPGVPIPTTRTVIASILPSSSDILSDDNYYSISLDSFNGQEGCIAFRHRSKHRSRFDVDNVCIYRTTDDWTTMETPENNIRLTGLRPQTGYEYQVQSMLSSGSFDWTDLAVFTTEDIITLAGKGDIDAIANGHRHDVMLQGLTLYRKRDEWNTLCLPFDVSDLSGTPLEGATIKELNDPDLSNGTLTLNFTDAMSIEAGKPYIIKLDKGADLVINNDDDWGDFVRRVNNGESFAGKSVALGGNINVSAETMVGTASAPFCGTFDGNGYTLMLSIDSDADYTAPFRYIQNAFIRNVKVTGSVNGGQYSAGIVGAALGGTNGIRDCWMAASVSGQSSVGGVLGHGTTSATTVSNCYLSGSLSATHVGVFYGGGSEDGTHTVATCWARGSYSYNVTSGSLDLLRSDGGTATVTSCYHNSSFIQQGVNSMALYDSYISGHLGSQWTTDGNGLLTMMPSADVVATNIENPLFYGVTVINDDPTAVPFPEGQFVGTYSPVGNTSDVLFDANNAGNGAFHAVIGYDRSALGEGFVDWYNDATLKSPATVIPFDADGKVTLYAGWRLELADDADNSETIASAVSSGKTYNRTVVLKGRRLYRDDDWNTLCLPFSMSAEQIEASPLVGVTVMELNGTTSSLSGGTLTLNFREVPGIEAGRPYIVKWQHPTVVINDAAGWDSFASAVNGGTESYAGKLVRLGADIDVSTMVGTASNPFCGTFDGNGHTLNLSIDSDADYTAPFRYIQNAFIRNVKVTGSVKGGQYCAGIVGAALGGTNSIRNCWMGASVSGQSSVGGVLGHGTSSATTIANCYLNGSLTGYSIGVFCGGGSTGGTHVLENCWALGEYNYPPTGNGIDLVKTDGGTASIVNCNQNANEAAQGTYNEIIIVLGSDQFYVDFLGYQWAVDGNGKLMIRPSVAVGDTDIESPVFTGVTIDNSAEALARQTVNFTGGSFRGTYSPLALPVDDRSNYFLGADNTLFWPNAANNADGCYYINACRAYFHIGNGAAVRSYRLNFNEQDGGTTTGILEVLNDGGKLKNDKDGAWYTLEGHKLDGQPTRKGLYLHNGRTVVIK